MTKGHGPGLYETALPIGPDVKNQASLARQATTC